MKNKMSREERIEEQRAKLDNEYKFFPNNLPPRLQFLLKKNRSPGFEISDLQTGYYISGPCGIGKSFKAACIVNEWCKIQMKAGFGYWLNVPALLENIRNSFRANERTNLIEEYSTAPIICLDDLGTEQGTAWVMQTLYLIINYRYDNFLPTVITSNNSIQQLSDKFEDDRLTSRIKGMCKIIEMDGEDLR